jgi:hypothetical protein
MTPEMRKTLVFIVVALLLTGAAVLKVPDRTGTNIAFNDQGQQFFADFKDPLACTDLEVVEYDGSTASVRQFKVMFKDNKWVIPSHHNYPADAKDRLAKTAAGVIDLTKDTIRSDRVDDQQALGVLDPLDMKAGLKGRGKRVTLRDKSEKVLADFIIGSEVKDRPGQHYVRVPGQKRTYGVNVKADLSTRFADWIETNLLKLDSSHIRSVTFDNHKVDPEAGRIIPGEVLRIDRKESFGPWTLDKPIPEGQELNTDKLNSLTSALADLKIVGVRTKPEGLSRELKMGSTNEVKPQSRAELQSLVNTGFYPTKDGLLSNQGDVVVKTDEGAVYTLRFGEALFATGDQLTAGGQEEAKANAEGKGKDDKAKGEGTAENRFLMVTVSFDPKLVPEPTKPAEGPLVIPDDPFQKAPDDPKRIAEEKAAKEKADKEKADRDAKLAELEKKVKALSDRFADWYYVTPGDSFRSIALDTSALLRPKTEKPAGETTPSTFPGSSGSTPGLPPGFQHP